MIRDEKLHRDRKILRRIDFNLAQQSRYVVAANILIFLFVASVGDLYVQYGGLVLAIGGLLLLLSGLSFYYSVRFDAEHGAGPARWRKIFISVQLGLALLMGVFTAMTVLFDHVSVNALLLSLYLAGSAAMNNMEWSPYRRPNTARHFLLLTPPVVAYVLEFNLNAMTIAIGLLLFLMMLIRQSRLMHERHWNNVRTHHELHLKARDLEQAVKEADSASRGKTEFLTSVTHELRTPMNNVLGMLALLDDTDLSPQQQELQKLAVQSGEGLLALIDDILDFSRIVSGQIQLNEAVFNLKRCVDQTLDLLGPRAHEKGIELSSVYDDDLPVRVKGDQERLAQVISNLVSNAIKYSAGTDILLSVHLQRLSEMEGELKIEVRDNGKGIDPDLQEHLFDAFSKHDKEQPSTEPGTGLGLAISKGLVQCMRGEIGFSSEPDKGTLFWFTARLKLSTQQAQKPVPVKELMNLRVLMVDVEGWLREAVVADLAIWQMKIVFASSQCNVTETLLAAFRADEPYDLLVINQPPQQKTNIDLCLQLQTVPELQQLRVLMLGSLSQRADAARLAGVETLIIEWVSKPVTRDKLSRALVRLFQLDVPAPEPEPASPEALARRHILLVDDNAVSQMVARGMLIKLGYVVTCAANGKEALGMLAERRFDLILMDCLMPGLDGYATTRAWREREQKRGGHIPIIGMTANVVDGEYERCLAAGMDDYLAKPVNIDALNAKMHDWLESPSRLAASPSV